MSTKVTLGWKVFTHDLRPPVRGGNPVWNGSLPHTLPKVPLDRSANVCGNGGGWHFSLAPQDALRIAGLWPSGRPSRLFVVEAEGEVVVRGDKCRAASLTIAREADESEVEVGVRVFSAVFHLHVEWMVEQQLAWREALARPLRDEDAIEAGLREALKSRRLDWRLWRFDSAMEAWAAWEAWAARAAREAREAWEAWEAWEAREAWAAWEAWEAWAAWEAWEAWAAWEAWEALTLGFASRQGWVKHDALLLTHGLRDAYRHGMEIALPTGPAELGWAVTP